jgi:hypothetical protein
MTICVLAVDGGVGAVPQNALHHRGDLGSVTGAKLGVDAHRLAVHVPIDHDAGAPYRAWYSVIRFDDHDPNFFESDAHAWAAWASPGRSPR